jgi:hypothetical protein
MAFDPRSVGLGEELGMIHLQSPRRRIARTVPALWVIALLAVCSSGSALAAGSSSSSPAATQAKLAGKWKGHYSGAVSGHFTIHWKKTGTELNGTISLSNPKGKYGIGGHVHHGKIQFGAVGVGATYKGRVHGTKMSGTWKSGQGGGSWSAHSVS